MLSKTNEQRVLQDAMRECTFTPKTNKVKKSMKAANLYLQMEAFERLSQPLHDNQSQNHGGEGNFDQSHDGSESYGEYGYGYEGQIDRYQISEPLDVDNIKPSSPSFLKRWEESQKKKQQTVKKLLEQEKRQYYKPKLNKKSIKLVKEDFYSRLARSQQKSQTLRENLERRYMGKEYTFKPKINIMSKNLKGRTVKDMSEGDVALKTSKLELARMYARKHELGDVTFKPTRHTKDKYWDSIAQSKLKIASEPHLYADRVLEMRAKHEDFVKTAQLQKSQVDMAECTFEPEIHDTPEFIKRIAATMRATKGSCYTDGKPKGRPGWR